MNLILSYLKKYFKDYFHWGYYLSTLIFLAICIYFNYAFDFENKIIDSYQGSTKWLLMTIHMSFPYLSICLLMYVFRINRTWINSREFWTLFVFGFIVIGFERSFHYHEYLLDQLNGVDRLFVRKVFWWFRPFLTTFIPLILFYIWYERKKEQGGHWYGLALSETDFKPYLILILLVFIGMGIASFLSDLAAYYPRYLKSGGDGFAATHGWREWQAVLVYELVYASYFVNVELFFRGFLVIGFTRVLGGQAVMAMVGSYVFLHFGKPISECISSAFGGYLIGILAFHSQRVWGGIVLHVALAWSMELFAWLQKVWDK